MTESHPSSDRRAAVADDAAFVAAPLEHGADQHLVDRVVLGGRQAPQRLGWHGRRA
jgi:hypothetical protein